MLRPVPAPSIADAIAALPELADGIGTKLDTSVPGTVFVDEATGAFSGLVTAVNTAAETDVATVTIGPRSTVDQRTMVLDLIVSYTNNTGAPRDLTIKIKVAGTTIVTLPFTAVPTAATPRYSHIRFGARVVDFGAGNQSFLGLATANLTAAVPGADIAAISAPAGIKIFAPGAPLALTVTAQHSTASALLEASVHPSSVLRLAR